MYPIIPSGIFCLADAVELVSFLQKDLVEMPDQYHLNIQFSTNFKTSFISFVTSCFNLSVSSD